MVVNQPLEITFVQQQLVLVFPGFAPSLGSGGGFWGSIAGNLSDQTDLRNELQDKANTADLAAVALSGVYNDLTGKPNLALYQLRSEKGQPLGYAELDASGLILTSQLPSYVDDVLEYDTFGDLPPTGQSGKIYVVKTGAEANKVYRWSGSIYVEISPTLVLGETSTTAYRGDRGKIAYDHSQTPGNPHGATTSDITEGSNLYHTVARVLGTVLTGFSSASTTIVTAAHTILQAIGFLQGQVSTNKTTMDSHIADTNNPHNVTKTQVGLGNVDNTSDANKPVSIAQAVADAAILSSAQSYSDALVVGLRDDRGNFTPSGSYPTTGGSGPSGAIKKGDTYVMAGLGAGITALVGSQTVADGDTVRATIDTPGQTDANRSIIENNLGYTAENRANKDASGGYVGLTLFKINFKNALNTFTSYFTNSNTASRTYTFPNRDGTIADDTDLATKVTKNSPITPATKTKIQFDANGLIIAATDATTDDIGEGSTNLYHTVARVRSTVLTGLSLAAGTVVTAAHTILEAIGFLQNQVSANVTSISGKGAKAVSPVLNALMTMNASGDALKTAVTVDAVGNATGFASVNTNILGVNTVQILYSFADTATGSNARMSFPNGPVRKLTNASLVSVGAMAASYGDSLFVIQNATSVTITILNEDATQTASERFVTGNGSHYIMPPGAFVPCFYTTADSRWHLISTAKQGVVYSDMTNSSALTGVTTNTIMKSFLCKKNTFKVGSIIQVSIPATKTGSVGAYTITLYVNTSNSLSGATLLATSMTTNLSQKMTRELLVRSTNDTFGYDPSTSADNDFSSSAVVYASTNIDWTADQYIIAAVANVSILDSTVVNALIVQYG